jgi:hypothetical protein
MRDLIQPQISIEPTTIEMHFQERNIASHRDETSRLIISRFLNIGDSKSKTRNSIEGSTQT